MSVGFNHPWVLLLLAVPILLVCRGRGAAARITTPIDRGLHPRRRALRVLLATTHAAPQIALALAILILAGPMQIRPPQKHRELTNIQIVLDVSGSMGDFWAFPSRYSIAKVSIEEFTRMREGDAMGLILFGDEQIRWIPITTDLEAIRLALPFAAPETQPRHMGGTAIGAALRFAAKTVEAESEEGDRVIILVSDGESPDLRNGQHLPVAEALLDVNAKVYYLHVGTDTSSPEAAEIARLTGGEAFVARDGAATEAVFRRLDLLTKAQIVTVQAEPHEWYRPFSIALLATSAVHLVGLLGVRYTPW